MSETQKHRWRMGLGPKESSLLDRTGRPLEPWSNPFTMQCEQIERGQARRLRAIWYAERHRKAQKPEAPAQPIPKAKGYDIMWQWDGESIPSKGLEKDKLYTAAQLREAGFKLPKLAQRKGK
jgi:hypothetical protein